MQLARAQDFNCYGKPHVKSHEFLQGVWQGSWNNRTRDNSEEPTGWKSVDSVICGFVAVFFGWWCCVVTGLFTGDRLLAGLCEYLATCTSVLVIRGSGGHIDANGYQWSRLIATEVYVSQVRDSHKALDKVLWIKEQGVTANWNVCHRDSTFGGCCCLLGIFSEDLLLARLYECLTTCTSVLCSLGGHHNAAGNRPRLTAMGNHMSKVMNF